MAWIAANGRGQIYVFRHRPVKTDEGLVYNDVLEGMKPISTDACFILLNKVVTFADEPIEILPNKS